MADDNYDIARDFAAATDSKVEIVNESAPDVNSGDVTQNSNIIDLTTSEDPLEEIQDVQGEQPEEIESSLTDGDGPEEAQSSETFQDEDIRELNDEDALFVLNEKYGTNYENLENLLNDLESEKQQSNFASEQIENINRFVEETGRSVEDYYMTQTQDYEKMSDEQVVKEYLKLENPDLTQKEIDLFYNDTYKQGDEKYSEEQSDIGKIHLKRDSSKARQELLDLQEEYWSPNEDSGEMTQDDVEEMEDARIDFLNDMDSELDDIESLSFTVDESGETFDYQLTDDDRDVVTDTLENLDTFFDDYRDNEGEWDRERLAMDLIAMKLQGNIIRSVANQYRSKGAEQVLGEIKNPSFEPIKNTPSNKGNSIVDQINKHIFGD